MKENVCRYVISAIGKGGETYYTHCSDKQELKQWIADNKEKLLINEIKVMNKTRQRFLGKLSLKYWLRQI
ncbi:MAG TPA: hypothetical protein VEY51_06470 [Chondromyces sp.]|nr:hypothetical protein [Chondromyces sp.]